MNSFETENLKVIFQRYGFSFKRREEWEAWEPGTGEVHGNGCYEVYWPGMESPDAVVRDGHKDHDWPRLIENMVADAAAYYKIPTSNR
jgi:hypothetical protein